MGGGRGGRARPGRAERYPRAVRAEAQTHQRILRGSVAFVWVATGLAVAHPYYREVGGAYLDRLGLPHALMFVTCGFEVLLGAWVALRPARTAVTALQVAMVLAFTAILAALDPMLLVHPFGILTKNVPLLAVLLTAWMLEREGPSRRAAWALRVGVGAIWVTEGLLPKILFQQPMELAVVAGSGLVPIDPSAFLVFMGAAQLASGLGVLLLRGRWLRALLACQAAALVVLPVLVSVQDPDLWFHPFGPLTKNLPILAGTYVLARCSSTS